MKFTPKKSVLLFLTIIFLLLAVQVVSAASQSGNIFDSFKNIFGSDFGQLYKDNWWIVDLIVYLFFFGYVGKLALGNQFQGKGGSLGIVFGVILAIALVAFEAKTGFQLGSLGPFAMAILVLALAFITWKFFKGLGMGGGGAAAFAVVVIYGVLSTVASPLLNILRENDNPTIQMIASIIDLLLLIAVIAVAWNGFSFVFRMFRGGGSGGRGGGLGGWFGGGGGGGGGNGLAPLAPAPAVRQAEADEGRRENIIGQEERRQQAEEAAEIADLARIRNLDFRRDLGFRGVISALDIVIPILEARRFDDARRAEILTKLNEITNFNTAISNVQGSISASLTNLDALERTEIAELQRMAGIAKGPIRDELVERRFAKVNKGQFQAKEINALDKLELGWDQTQENLINAERKRSLAIIAKTRNTLIGHEREIRQLEGVYTKAYNEAMVALSSGQPNAAVRLRDARQALARALAIDQYSEKVDIPDISKRIRQEYSQLGLENRLRRSIGVGMRKRAAVEQAVAQKGQNFQRFIGTIKGKILKR